MTFSDIIVLTVLAVILFSAAGYISKAKKSGKKCIGCPEGGSCGSSCCSGHCSHCSGCHGSQV